MNTGYIVCRITEAERLCRKEQARFLVFALVGEITIAEAPVTWKWATEPASTTTGTDWYLATLGDTTP